MALLTFGAVLDTLAFGQRNPPCDHRRCESIVLDQPTEGSASFPMVSSHFHDLRVRKVPAAHLLEMTGSPNQFEDHAPLRVQRVDILLIRQSAGKLLGHVFNVASEIGMDGKILPLESRIMAPCFAGSEMIMITGNDKITRISNEITAPILRQYRFGY